jgi:hypothetical protein
MHYSSLECLFFVVLSKSLISSSSNRFYSSSRPYDSLSRASDICTSHKTSPTGGLVETPPPEYIAKGMKTVTGCPKKTLVCVNFFARVCQFFCSCVSIFLLVCVNLFARSIFFFAHQNLNECFYVREVERGVIRS